MEWTVTTILATGIKCLRVRSRCANASGFTLIELLLVIALIGMAGGVFILNFNRLLSRDDSETVEDSFRRAVSAARFEAAAQRIETALHWDSEAGQLIISDYIGGAQLQSISLDADFASGGSGQIRLYAVQTQVGIAAPFGSQQEEELTRVRFSPDRSGTPFRAVITRPGAAPAEKVFEPFSGMLLSNDGGQRL
jgi:prepilin-type N-terminal cleavage/methylation domain-containing protein